MPGGLESRLLREKLRAQKLETANAMMDMAGPQRDFQEAMMLEALFGQQQQNNLRPFTAAGDLAYQAGATGSAPHDVYAQLLASMGLGDLLQQQPEKQPMQFPLMPPQTGGQQFDPAMMEAAQQALLQFQQQ